LFNNLEAEIKRKQIHKEDIAIEIGKTYPTLTRKLNGQYPFTYKEALLIHERFFPECDFKTLFSED